VAAELERNEGKRKDDSLDKIYACVDNNKSFILDAGAGSGKTWSLIKTLEYIIENKGTEYTSLAKKIGCITYTNVAVDEIKERIGENSVLIVNTIHDFFWDIIGKYQQELKEVIIDIYDDVDIEYIKNKNIEYKEFKVIKDGIISHDEVIKISWEMFLRYSKLRRIFMDRFPVVLVDEYQDTDKNIVNIFFECLSEFEDSYRTESNNFMVGFFGDFMQSIYDKGIGSIDKSDILEHIPKETNYRSSEQVINLLNTIREDINQYPAGKNKDIKGSVSFLYLESEEECSSMFESDTLNLIKDKLQSAWGGKVKELLLSHTEIAKRAGYENIFNVYKDYYPYYNFQEKLFEKECPISSFLLNRVEASIELYNENRIFDLMEKIDYKFLGSKDKMKLKSIMDNLLEYSKNEKLKVIWEYVFNNNLFVEDDKLKEFRKKFAEDEERKEFFEKLMDLNYQEIKNLYNHVEKESIVSTKHNTKGDEFENVLIIVGERTWNNYNFPEYLTGNIGALKDAPTKVYDRTNHLFYVSCSRAIKNLAILYLNEQRSAGLTRVQDWFGSDNVITVTEFLGQ